MSYPRFAPRGNLETMFGNWYGPILLIVVLLPLLSGTPARAGDATVAGEVQTPFPTITNLAVEWLIEGDDNENGRVEVHYRADGDTDWQRAMDLWRVSAGTLETYTSAGPDRARIALNYSWKNRHSGSILDLRPDTEYEIKLLLEDPDGGSAERVVRARTRAVPRPVAGGPVKKVNPHTLTDTLLTARPGDIILLVPGYYRETEIPCNGEPGRPIVIRADNSHPVIGSNFDSLSLVYRSNLILDGLTVNGPVDLQYAENISIRYCKINSQFGIVATDPPGATNCYIADNVISYNMPWVREGIGSGSIWSGAACVGEGIQLTGSGNVICYNRVSGYRDCISTMEGLDVYNQYCIDIYNNEIDRGCDDGVEADFCYHNVRVMRNRITNCGMGLSSQPTLGGPVYYVRNSMYNIAMCPFKVTRGSSGAIFLHNSAVKVGDGFYEHHGQGSFFRTVFRNNLAVGGIGGGPSGRYSSGEEGLAVNLPGFNETCVFDHNAVGTYRTQFAGRLGREMFRSTEELNGLTGGGSVRVYLEDFLDGLEFPHPIFASPRAPADLRLQNESAAVDNGARIFNVNDNFTGSAPDIGAYELGGELPHYGPRPRGVDEGSM